MVLIDIYICIGIVIFIVYGLYRIIISEKDKDIKRKEDDIRRKDAEIERLKKDRDLGL